MERPLVPAFGFCASALLAVLASAAPTPSPATDAKAPKELRQLACGDGVYVRKKASPAAKKATKPKPKPKKTKKNKDGTVEEESGFDSEPDDSLIGESGDGGDFTPAGGGLEGTYKFTPKGDCSGFDKLFTCGKNGSPAPADSLEIAPAAVGGKPLAAEEVNKRFVSLSALSKLKAADASAVKRFFDGSATSADKATLAKYGVLADFAGIEAGDNVVRADGPKGPRAPLAMSAPKKVLLDQGLNDAASPAPIKPLSGAAPTPPPAYQPYDPGTISRVYNNAKAEMVDYFAGSPIANAEGERTILPNPTPVYDTPGSDQGVNVRLPAGPGVKPRCEPGCYGTMKMIKVLVGMGQDYDAFYKSAKAMSVGGISRLGGGYFPPHVSHQHGIDADISFAGTGRGFDALANAMVVAAVVRRMPGFHHINGREYILCDQSKHAAVGWGLDQLVAQGNLTKEQAERGKSVLVHWPNHNDHFHIRILP